MKFHIEKEDGRAYCGRSIENQEKPERIGYHNTCAICRSILSKKRRKEVRRLEKERKAAGHSYTSLVYFEETNRYGCGLPCDDDVYTIEEFREACEQYAFTDYDGFGYPVKDNFSNPHVLVYPSNLRTIPKDATHIVWFNK